jgi:hypothetical protein
MGVSTSKRDWILAAAGLLMIAAAVRITIGNRAPAPAAAPPVQTQTAPVALYVQHDGTALRLHWNPDADAVRGASKGALLIGDGPRQSRLDLGPAELRSGVASYWPESQGVVFKLELDGVVAGELQAPALEVRAEPRPSPFDDAPEAKPAPRRAALVDADDDDTPKPHTVRASETQAADRVDEKDEEPVRKPSKWHRITGKIPLIRRLQKH